MKIFKDILGALIRIEIQLEAILILLQENTYKNN